MPSETARANLLPHTVRGGCSLDCAAANIDPDTFRRRTRIVVLASCLGFFLINFDTTIVNVALPAISSDMGAPLSDLTWVVVGYILAFAGLLLSAGALADRVGASRVFGLGLLGFMLTSAACGLAPTTVWLVIARVLQGAVAAAVLPASLALLRQSLTNPAARARAIAVWAAGGGAAVAVGPLVGGSITTVFGWRAVFFINIPVGLLAIVGLLHADRSAPRSATLDPVGQIAVIVVLTSLTFAVTASESHPPGSLWVIVPLALFIASVLWFWRVESISAAPLIDLHELRSPVFVSCLSTGFALNFGYYGIMFVFSIVFHNQREWTPLQVGLSFVPLTIFVVASNIAGGRLTTQFGPRFPMAAAQLLDAAGFAMVAVVGANGTTWMLLLAMVPIGIGGGIASPPMMTALLETVRAERAGMVSGLLSSFRQVGGVLGVAVFALMISNSGFGMTTGSHVAAATAASLLALTATTSALCIQPGHAHIARNISPT